MRRFLAAGAILASLSLAACGANDAQVGNRDHAPADVINFPNHFSSVADKCDGHGHRVFIGDHGNSGNGGGGVAVIADASCGAR